MVPVKKLERMCVHLYVEKRFLVFLVWKIGVMPLHLVLPLCAQWWVMILSLLSLLHFSIYPTRSIFLDCFTIFSYSILQLKNKKVLEKKKGSCRQMVCLGKVVGPWNLRALKVFSLYKLSLYIRYILHVRSAGKKFQSFWLLWTKRRVFWFSKFENFSRQIVANMGGPLPLPVEWKANFECA